MMSYKWTVEDWKEFWGTVKKLLKEQKQNQVIEDLEEWRKKAHKEFRERHIRRIINFDHR